MALQDEAASLHCELSSTRTELYNPKLQACSSRAPALARPCWYCSIQSKPPDSSSAQGRWVGSMQSKPPDSSSAQGLWVLLNQDRGCKFTESFMKVLLKRAEGNV